MYCFVKCCRLCLSTNENLSDLNCSEEDNISYYKKIVHIMPTLYLTSSVELPTVLCEKCKNQIDEVAKFIKKSFHNQELLVKYHLLLQSVGSNTETKFSELKFQLKQNYEQLNHSLIESANDIKSSDKSSTWLKHSVIFPDPTEKTKLETVENKEECNNEPPQFELLTIKREVRFDDTDSNTYDPVLSHFLETNNTENENTEEFADDDTNESTYSTSTKTKNCPICKKIFPNKHNFQRHYNVVHSKKRPFTCYICDKTFPDSSNLDNHKTIVHFGIKKYQCHLCDKQYTYQRTLRSHLKTTHKDQYGPLAQGSGNIDLDEIEEILPTSTEPVENAADENDNEDDNASNDSLDEESQRKIKHKARKFKCSHCSKHFKKINRYDEHMRTHTNNNPYECDVCFRTFISPWHLMKHKNNHEGQQSNQKCVICELVFNQLEDFKQHWLSHLNKGPFNCEVCKRKFDQCSELISHKESYSQGQIDLNKASKCCVCELDFKQQDIFQKHILDHTEIKPYQCEFCKKSFLKGIRLRNHIKVVHLRIKNHECHVCKKRFDKPNRLRDHMKRHDKGKKIGKGKEIVNDETQTSEHIDLDSSLNETDEVAANVNEKFPFQCDICMKQFKQVAHLMGHKKSHIIGPFMAYK